MKVVSLNVALPEKRRYQGRKIITGGNKRTVSRAMLRYENFDGDGQGDQVNHGGPDKAGCMYPMDHYSHWERELGRELAPGSMSENLTVCGAVETEVCIGDVFRVGGAIVQVTQPRVPCSKLAGKNEQRRLVRQVSETGYTGFYARVLSEGMVDAGDAFERVERHPEQIPVAAVNDALYERSGDFGFMERLVSMPEFAASGRALFVERLDRMRRQRR